METLNHLIRLADLSGLFQSLHTQIKERIFLYADDVVLFSSPAQKDLTLLKSILQIFADATGLKTNLNKCRLSPIQCDLQATVVVTPQVFNYLNQGH